MRTLSPSEEQNLLAAVKTAVDYVDNQDMTPNEALIKVARDDSLTPGFVRAAVSAYNNGRQVAQFRANESVLDKLAGFPLADYDEIHKEIWGGSEKAAMDHYQVHQQVSPEYSLPPSFIPDRGREKLAGVDLTGLLGATEPHVPDQEHQALLDKHASDKRMRTAYHAYRDACRRFEDVRTKCANARDLVTIRVKALENYFKKFAMDRLPFEVVDDAVLTYHGSDGRALMNLLAQSFPNEKRAADSRVFWDKPLDPDQAPFCYVRDCIGAAKQVGVLKKALDEAQEDVKVAQEALRPFSLTPQPQLGIPSASLLPGTEKQAFGLMGGAAVGAGTRTLLDKALGPGGKKDAVEKAWLDLEDPNHENELRRIRAQAMLSSMMSDPENPISGYEPDEVLSAYNELAQIAPRAAGQPAALQPLLAKRLAGNVEPFEVQEITNLEKGLRESKEPTPTNTNILKDAPQSILG